MLITRNTSKRLEHGVRNSLFIRPCFECLVFIKKMPPNNSETFIFYVSALLPDHKRSAWDWDPKL